MGRTLHYTIERKDGKPLDKRSITVMVGVNQKYTAGEMSKVWTCERVSLDPYAYYPNWEYWEKKGKRTNAWDEIGKCYNELREGKPVNVIQHIAIIKKMVKDKLICLHWDDPTEFHSFTKVQGNEFNSLLVYQALIELSTLCPNLIIEMHDEGEFLLCDVLIARGKVYPKIVDAIDTFTCWAVRAVLPKHKEGLNADFLSCFNEKEQDALGLEYNSTLAMRYANDVLRNLATLSNRLKEEGHDLSEYRRSYKYAGEKVWVEPFVCSRAVNIEKFKDYKMSPGTLMDGFEGEGFGLSDNDSEKQSYEMIAKMKKMFGTAGDITMQVLGEKTNKEE